LKHRDRNYVTLIYNRVKLSFVGNAFSIVVAKINRENPGPKFELSTFPVEGGSPNSYERALREIKEWGWKTVAVSLGHLDQWEQMYDQVEKQGMALGEHGYVWYSFDTIDLDTLAACAADWIPTPPGKAPGMPAARARLLHGSGHFRVLDGFEDDAGPCRGPEGPDGGGGRRFLCSWRNLTGADAAVLRDLHPVEWGQGATGRHDPPDNYFQTKLPTAYSALAYDAIVALDMATCRVTYLPSDYRPRARPPRAPEHPFTNQDSRLYNELALNTTFRGASGPVRVHNRQFYTRPSSTLTFGVYNVRAVGAGQNNETAFEQTLASVRRLNGEGGGEHRGLGRWTDVAEFRYTDGGVVAPANYVPPPELAQSNAGLYAAIALGAVLGTAVLTALAWTVAKRYRVYCRIIQEHERRMEATVDEAERALYTLDYPLHLLRGTSLRGRGSWCATS
jgi:hypothetical protein